MQIPFIQLTSNQKMADVHNINWREICDKVKKSFYFEVLRMLINMNIKLIIS